MRRTDRVANQMKQRLEESLLHGSFCSCALTFEGDFYELAFRLCCISNNALQALKQATDRHPTQFHQFLPKLTDQV